MGPESPRVGALVIRAWLENDDPSKFRARVVHTMDVTSGTEAVSAAATPDAVLACVREWLEVLLRRD